jgi:hypothetical protein
MYINNQEFVVYKDHIKGNEGVPHPEVPDLIPVKDKEHSHVIIHCFSKHETALLFCRGYCELNIKPARFRSFIRIHKKSLTRGSMWQAATYGHDNDENSP